MTAAMLSYVDASLTATDLVFDLVESEEWEGGAAVTEYPVERGPNVADNVRPVVDKCTLRVFATNEPINSTQWTAMRPAQLQIGPPTPFWVPGGGVVQYNEYENNIQLRALAGTAVGLLGGIAGPVGGAIGVIGGGAVLGAAIPAVTVPQVFVTDGGLPTPTPIQPTTVKALQVVTPDDYVRRLLDLLDQLKNTAQLITVVGSKKSVDNMVIERITQRRSADTGSGAEVTISFRQIRMVDTQNVPAPSPTLPRAQAPVSHGAQSTTDATPKQSALFGLTH